MDVSVYRRGVGMLRYASLSLKLILVLIILISILVGTGTFVPGWIETGMYGLFCAIGVSIQASAANLCFAKDRTVRWLALLSLGLALTVLFSLVPEALWLLGGLQKLVLFRMACVLGSVLALVGGLLRMSVLLKLPDLVKRAGQTLTAMGVVFALPFALYWLDMRDTGAFILLVCGIAFLVGSVSFVNLVKQLGEQLVPGSGPVEDESSSVAL